ncbi:hypothetical protein GEMRC1_013193 [Eukaryota sp. GEM-RC1]
MDLDLFLEFEFSLTDSYDRVVSDDAIDDLWIYFRQSRSPALSSIRFLCSRVKSLSHTDKPLFLSLVRYVRRISSHKRGGKLAVLIVIHQELTISKLDRVL